MRATIPKMSTTPPDTPVPHPLGAVWSCVATLKMLVVPAGSGFTVWNVTVTTCGDPYAIGFVTSIVHSVPAADPPVAAAVQSVVVPLLIAVNVVFCGTTS